jgi:hypothetical protein
VRQVADEAEPAAEVESDVAVLKLGSVGVLTVVVVVAAANPPVVAVGGVVCSVPPLQATSISMNQRPIDRSIRTSSLTSILAPHVISRPREECNAHNDSAELRPLVRGHERRTRRSGACRRRQVFTVGFGDPELSQTTGPASGSPQRCCFLIEKGLSGGRRTGLLLLLSCSHVSDVAGEFCIDERAAVRRVPEERIEALPVIETEKRLIAPAGALAGQGFVPATMKAVNVARKLPWSAEVRRSVHHRSTSFGCTKPCSWARTRWPPSSNSKNSR